MPVAKTEHKSFYPATRNEWRSWLQKNHNKEMGVWLICYNKSSGKPSLTYNDTVEEALCFGWIDSIKNKIDEHSSKQFFSPRNPKSAWSKLNKTRIKKLIKESLMHESGLVKIKAAKKNGTWTTLDSIENLIMPPPLAKAIGKNKKAFQHFEAFPPSVKKGIYFWIQSAKTPETLNKRILETVTLAAENKRANQYVKKT